MELNADEFLRRFLLHVLPARFVRIRHFGFLVNRVRSKNLNLAREQLGSYDCRTQPVRDGLSIAEVYSMPDRLDVHYRNGCSTAG